MPDRLTSRPLEVLEIGPIARRALLDGARGQVGAVFERSCYVVVNGQWVCVGPHALGSGPLNALCALPVREASVRRPALGDSVSILGGRLYVGSTSFASFARTREWAPVVAAAWDDATLARGLQAFDGLDESLLPGDGLAVLCRPHRRSAEPSGLAAAAEAPALHLADLVRAAVADSEAPRRVDTALLIRLLGLGPGLTPSGDDVLGGAMVALDVLGHRDLRDEIWTSLKPFAVTRTNEISRAHLTAAAEGYGAAALHHALNSLLSGATDGMRSRLSAIDAIGHTSGWDALAGALIVLRAYRDARRMLPPGRHSLILAQKF